MAVKLPALPEVWFFLGLLLLLWPLAQSMVQMNGEMVGIIDPNIYLLMMLSLMNFLGLLGLCWCLLNWCWSALNLTPLSRLVVHFKTMEVWQQLSFYFASFALLLLVAVGCLIAIC